MTLTTRKRNMHLAALTLMLSLPAMLPAQVTADADLAARVRALRFGSPEMRQAGVELTGGTTGLFAGAAPAAAGSVVYLVRLSQSPAVSLYRETLDSGLDLHLDPSAAKSAAVRAGQDQVVRLRRAQSELEPALLAPPIGARTLYRLQRVLNGIVIRVDRSRLGAIRRLPGVAEVLPIAEALPATSTSVPWVLGAGSAPILWTSGNTGAGIRIGIVDSGVDYIHTGLGGDGLVSQYAANDTTVVEPGGSFPNSKVVGGWDFVGDAYSGDNDPAPDADPMDCSGHGSHVAAIAAGPGVRSNGATYAGPYDDSTPFAAMQIGPGVAPQASLYALRVFGCSGGTRFVEAAIEWAVDPDGDGDFADHLDVLNLSLGTSYGGSGSTSSLAADAAVDAGVIVVAAAGNAGDTFYASSAPASARKAIAAAAAADLSPAVQVNNPVTLRGSYLAANALFGPGLAVTGAITAQIALAVPSLACSPLLYPGAITGRIALVDRGECEVTEKVRNAQDAGALAVLVANSEDENFVPLAGTDATITIPTQLIPRELAEEIREELAVPHNVEVTLSNNLGLPDNADAMAPWSSRGPARSDGPIRLKPDIAAPGEGIASVAALTGHAAMTLSGTSAAAPHIAGAMALLRQRYPDASVAELKSLAMTHSLLDLHSRQPDGSLSPGSFEPSAVGAGRIDLSTSAIAPINLVLGESTDDPGVVSLSFGNVELATTPFAQTRNLTIANQGASAKSFAVTVASYADAVGVSYSVDPAVLSIPAGGTRQIAVTLAADPSAMSAATTGMAAETGPSGLSRLWQVEESGFVRLDATSGGGSLRIPVYATLRPASTLAPASTTVDFAGDPSGSAEVPLTGTPIVSSDEATFATILELQESSPDDPQSAGIADHADLRYVGVGSNFPVSGDLGSADTLITFGLAVYGPWFTINEVEFDIFIDRDRDGAADYVLFNWNHRRATGDPDPSDESRTYLLDLATLSLVEELSPNLVADFGQRSNTTFNNDVVGLAVHSALLGLSGNAPAPFDYFVDTFGDIGFTDESAVHTFDPTAPGIDASAPGATGYNWSFASENEPLRFAYDAARFAADRALGALVLFHNNVQGSRAAVIAIDSALADLSVVKSSDALEPVALDDPFTYTLTVENQGPGTAANATVVDDVPAELVIVSTTGPCTTAGRRVTCTWPSIPARGREAATIAVQVASLPTNVGRSIDNTATVTAPNARLNPDNDSDTLRIVAEEASGGEIFADGFESASTARWSFVIDDSIGVPPAAVPSTERQARAESR